MTVSPGTQIGPYQVLSPLGAGGMGVVFKARDVSLDREVALKFLSADFTDDPEWRRRFEREARLLASLHHPNLATVFRFETELGAAFLVMELVPGQTLDARIGAGPLPLDETLAICAQVAAGLEVAHDAGIVHRDLKPANIKITPTGAVKLLDFGLAKSVREAAATDASLPTATSPHTRQGTVMGTAPYMSPEQARGKPTDARTDIWALACVMYELLTGHRAFPGDTPTDTVAAVLRGDPDWNALPSGTPTRLRELLRRCLQKDPARRLRDARDVRLTIEEIGAEPHPADASSTTPTRYPRSRLLAWSAAGLIVGAAMAALVLSQWPLSRTPAAGAVMRFPIPVDAPSTLYVGLGPSAAISPDGASLVYALSAADDNTPRQLNLRRLVDADSTPVAGSTGAASPFFSPNGDWIGFFSDNKLKKVRVGGGEAVVLADAPFARGATWLPDDTIIFSARQGAFSTLFRVPAAGGVVTPVKGTDTPRQDHMIWPQVLPGGTSVLFTAWANAVDASNVMVLSLETGAAKLLVKGATYPCYAKSGHLLFARIEGTTGSLWAARFDDVRLEVNGDPGPVAQIQVNAGGAAQYAVSDAGTLVYMAPRRYAKKTLVWVGPKGMTEPLVTTRRAYSMPRLSPDGTKIAVSIRENENADIWIHDIARNAMTALTAGPAVETAPIWSPDGVWVAYSSSKDGVVAVIRKRADGSGAEERLTTPAAFQIPGSWSPDGKRISYSQRQVGNVDIWMLPIDADRKPQPFLVTPGRESGGAFSPDGQLVAFVQSDATRNQVVVRQFPDTGKYWQVSNSGGAEPVWSHDGKRLFYRAGNRILAVDVTTVPAFRAGPPYAVFDAAFDPEVNDSPGHAAFDVAADGRFVFPYSDEGRGPDHVLSVVVNWFEELRRRSK